MKHKLTRTKKLGMKISSILFAMIFIISSCNQNEDELAPIQENLPSLTEALEAFDEEVEYQEYSAQEGQSDARWGYRKWKRKPTFFTLVSALNYTGLLRTVVKEKLTIFAPDDKAFAKMGLNFWNIRKVDKDALTNILLSHVAGGFVFSNELPGCSIETINGSSIGLTSMNGGLVLKDDSEEPINLLFTDRRALNSIFHGIDKVLELGIPEETIASIAITNGSFNELVAALKRTSGQKVDLLAAVLDPEANLTVFAPVDQAFFDLYEVLEEILMVDEIDIDGIPLELLTQVLLHHVVGDRAFSYCLSDGLMVPTLNGDDVTVNLKKFTLRSSGNNTVGLVTDPFLLDIQATNGVIHVIDGVLLPQNVLDVLLP